MDSVSEGGRYKSTWKREFKLPWRKAGLLKIMSLIKWIRTSGLLSMKNSLSVGGEGALTVTKAIAFDAWSGACRWVR